MALLGLALLALPTARAQAQPRDTVAPPDVRLVVTAIDGLVGPAVDPPPDDEPARADDLGLRVLVDNRSDEDMADLQVVVEVRGRVQGARSVLAAALDEQAVDATERGPVERVDLRDGGELPAGDIAGAQITVDGSDIAWRGTNDVYPVEISVLRGTQVLDRVVTAVVHIADADVLQRPLQTSVVWPIGAPTTRTAGGRYPDAVPDALAPGGRIDTLLSALEEHPDAAVMIAPEVELLEELADRADGFVLTDGTEVADDDPAAVHAGRLLERLRARVADAALAPVVGPYGRADVAALQTAPGTLPEMASTAIDAARTRARALLGRAPRNDVHLSTTPLTPASMDLLDDGTQLLLPFGQVQATRDLVEDIDVGHARHLVPDNGDDGAPRGPQRLATIADPRVTEVVTDPPTGAGQVVARQRLVAETALLHLTRPGEAGRALLVLPPVQWDPARGLASELLSALASSPWLELTAPERLPPGRTSAVDLATAAAALPGGIAAELTSAREQLAALRAAMPSGLPDLDGQSVADLDDALLRSVTPDALARAGAEALGRIRAVRDVAEAAFGQVELPDDAAVTLTSETGEVPVTVQRTRGGDIELLVEVDSAAGLLWDESTQSQRITLPEGASRTVAFDARAAARGTFAVTVSVWDPTRSRLLDAATLSVRSTAISRTALLIIGGVVLVLLAVGARRRRSPTLEVVR